MPGLLRGVTGIVSGIAHEGSRAIPVPRGDEAHMAAHGTLERDLFTTTLIAFSATSTHAVSAV